MYWDSILLLSYYVDKSVELTVRETPLGGLAIVCIGMFLQWEPGAWKCIPGPKIGKIAVTKPNTLLQKYHNPFNKLSTRTIRLASSPIG